MSEEVTQWGYRIERVSGYGQHGTLILVSEGQELVRVHLNEEQASRLCGDLLAFLGSMPIPGERLS
jgi:hypothetical protein